MKLPHRQQAPASANMRPTRRLIVLAVALALLWLLLTGGVVASWIVGVPVIALALAAVHRLWPEAPRWRVVPAGAMRFLAFFVRESLRGGIDVARRVGGRRPRVAPGLLRYAWRLPPEGPWRLLFVLAISLLPGTLVAAVGEDDVLVHVLDVDAPVPAELAELERRVAGLFGLHLVDLDHA